MTSVTEFHKNLLGSDPTPEQLRLYESPDYHGYSNDARNSTLFIGTLVLALYTAFEADTGIFHEVVFAVPKPIEGFAFDTIKRVITAIAAKRSTLEKKIRIQGGKLIAEAFKKLHLGHRVYTIAEEPPRWVAFGFLVNSPSPAWLRSGLLVLNDE